MPSKLLASHSHMRVLLVKFNSHVVKRFLNTAPGLAFWFLALHLLSLSLQLTAKSLWITHTLYP